jgi:hypothetical protein
MPATSHHVELRQATNEADIVARLQSLNVYDGALIRMGHVTTALHVDDFPLTIELYGDPDGEDDGKSLKC